MARIELRNSTIRFVDGYGNTAAVNQLAVPPVNGDTVMTIDTVVATDFSPSVSASQVIPLSSRFTVVGSTETYTVTVSDANALLTIDLDDASSGTFTITVAGQVSGAIAYDAIESVIQTAVDGITGVSAGDFLVVKAAAIITVKATADGAFANEAVTMSADFTSLTATAPTQVQTYAGGVTHDITFTPALATADGIPADNAIITFTGRTLSIKVGDGNAEYTENREFNYDLDRGVLDTVRQGDDQPVDVSLDFVWEFLSAISGVATPTPSDVLHHRGPAADWLSSSDDLCEPYAIDIEIDHTQPCGGEPTEYIVLPDFRWESLPHSLTDAQISMTGRCNATEALVSRAAA